MILSIITLVNLIFTFTNDEYHELGMQVNSAIMVVSFLNLIELIVIIVLVG